jgi:hypothetical protein
MKVPQGLAEVEGIKEKNGTILKLNKSIYGLVQAARQWDLRKIKLIHACF